MSKKTADRRSRVDPFESDDEDCLKKTKTPVVMTLYEKVNVDILQKILSANELPETTRIQLRYYYHRLMNGVIPVNYYFSKKLKDRGRLFAEKSSGLQAFRKDIRHALAKENYYDIDVVNCAPTMISQYCKEKKIKCPNLQKYVDNREKILKDICDFHEVTRESAKNLIIRILYGSNYKIEIKDDNTDEVTKTIVPEKKMPFVIKLKKELRRIAAEVCEIEKDIYKIVQKDDDRGNKEFSALSIVSHQIEHKCLMAMYEFFKKMKCDVGSLCFDGLMVHKSKSIKNIAKTLVSCSDYIYEKTNYKITLLEKPMDSKLTIELPEYSKFVSSDLECQQKLFKIEGSDTFKFCQGELYIFDEDTGMYSTSIETLFHYFVKNKDYLCILKKNGDTISYGESSSLMLKPLPFIRTAAVDDEWLKRTQKTSLGYILFKDGIYNMIKGKMKYEFDKKIVFHERIPRDYPPYDQAEYDKAYEITFKKLFIDPKPMIATLARALAGDVCFKKFYFCPGRSNAGKSSLVKILQNAFGGYVGEFNAESLSATAGHDTKDEAAKMRWAFLLCYRRILLSNEVCMKKELDGNAIKKHSSGGDKIIARLHSGNETSFNPHYTIFCLLNDIPKIIPMDEAVEKRLEYMEFPYVFVDEKDKDQKTYYRQKDLELEQKIEDPSFINGFIHIILKGYKKYLVKGMPEFDKDVKQRWTAENKQSSEIIDTIKNAYNITLQKNDIVSIADLKKFREKNKTIFSTISVYRFNEILKDDLGLVEDRNSTARFWRGISKNDTDFDMY